MGGDAQLGKCRAAGRSVPRSTAGLRRVGVPAGALGSTAEQSLATSLGKESQGSVVGLFNLVFQSKSLILGPYTTEKIARMRRGTLLTLPELRLLVMPVLILWHWRSKV